MAWFNFCLFLGVTLILMTFGALSTAAQPMKTEEKSLLLSYECVNLHNLTEERNPVVMVHGLLDSKKTWAGIYQTIPFLTNRRVCIYDARNHGDSGWNDTFTLDVLVEDLGNFMRDMKIEKAALVGHSLGGLTVMRFALNNPSKVERIFIEDISSTHFPKKVVGNVSTFLAVLMQSLGAIPKDANEETAKQHVMSFVRKHLSEEIMDDASLELYFKSNTVLQRNGIWQFNSNIEVFIKYMRDSDLFNGHMEGTYDGPAFFIYGAVSPFKIGDQKDIIRKMFPKAEFAAVEGAGHLIHPTFPEYLKELIPFLK